MRCSQRQNKQPVGHFIFATLILDSLKEKKKKNQRKSKEVVPFSRKKKKKKRCFCLLPRAAAGQRVLAEASFPPSGSESLAEPTDWAGDPLTRLPVPCWEHCCSFSLQKAILNGPVMSQGKEVLSLGICIS